MLALILAIMCATDSPSATVTIQDHATVQHGTLLKPCPLTIEGNYERLVRLMGRPGDVSEVQQVPGAMK